MRNTLSILVLAAFGAFSPNVQAVPARPDVAPVTGIAHARALRDGLDRPAMPPARLPPQALVLPVDFPDQAHADNWTPAALEDAFFGAEGSVRHYYERASYGRYAPQGSVHPWVRLSRTQEFYTDRRAGIGGADPRNARRMVADAVRAVDAQVDFSQFDNDGPDGIPSSGDDDGQVDALMVVHAGATQEETGRNDRFLSHSWFTPEPVATDDGVFVWSYALVGEASPLGVRAHEFGHLLGLPDLYDRGAVSQTAPGGIGDWSLMATGAWLGNGPDRDGTQPADLDAPSKLQLGFVDAIVPGLNAQQLPLRARDGQRPPDVYQIWTHGRVGHEFFVVVNRRRTDLDVALPNGGMLVYHVNLARATNDDPADLRVQLLQADGLAQIEGFVNSGDADDPWPAGCTGSCRLDANSNPSTRARDGRDSQVVISSISTPSTTMHCDVQIEDRALFEVVSHTLNELQGDGDGIPEAGEVLEFVVEIENGGLGSQSFDLAWRSDPVEAATWSVDTARVAALAKNGRTSATFVLQAAATLPDPAALRLLGEAVESDDTRHALERTLALGERTGFLACLDAEASSVTRDCDDPTAAWSVETLRGTGSWSLESSPGDVGSLYRSARGARYPNAVDVALVTPAFNLEPGSEVHVLHDFDIEELAAGWAHDGGRVEISLHGGAWTALVPERGYSHALFPESVPYLAGAGVFSGRGARRWDVFPLDGTSASARLRFRFVSNDSIGASGWRLARVEVRSTRVDAPTTRLRVIAEPNPTRVPSRIAFRIEAPRSVAAQTTRLLVYDVRGRLVRELSHAPVPAQSAFFFWDGMDRAGRVVPAGVYWSRLEWGGETATAKLVVIR